MNVFVKRAGFTLEIRPAGRRRRHHTPCSRDSARLNRPDRTTCTTHQRKRKTIHNTYRQGKSAVCRRSNSQVCSRKHRMLLKVVRRSRGVNWVENKFVQTTLKRRVREAVNFHFLKCGVSTLSRDQLAYWRNNRMVRARALKLCRAWLHHGLAAGSQGMLYRPWRVIPLRGCRSFL